MLKLQYYEFFTKKEDYKADTRHRLWKSAIFIH